MTQSPETQTPEQSRSTEEINAALDYAQGAVNHLRHDPSFHAACVEAGVDPVRNSASAEYLHTFRLYVSDRVDTAKRAGQDDLRMNAIELLATTPAYILEEHNLTAKNHTNYQETHYSKEVASYYNSLVRSFAANYPQTSVQHLRASLLTTVSETLHNRTLRQAAASQVTHMLRGAQHELAFGQILEQTGLPYRGAELEEDLKGTDYVIALGKKVLAVDVKASLTEVGARGSEGLYAASGVGKIVMYSMTLDHEFKDRFFTDEATAETKAPQLVQQLTKAYKIAS